MRASNILKVIYKYLVFMFFVVGIFPSNVKAQDPLKDLRVIGSSVQFIYSTLSSYNNGVQLSGKTQVNIRYKYTGHPNWELRLNAMESSIEYEGSSTYDIPLSDLVLDVTATAGVTVNTPFVLTDTPQVLASGGGGEEVAPSEFTVTISYELPSMINKPEGVYLVNLYFLLVEEGG